MTIKYAKEATAASETLKQSLKSRLVQFTQYFIVYESTQVNLTRN